MVATNQCSECGSSESLWICLICGHIGCGRYVHGHAYKHFCETQHCYAIQPDNNRVWDYVSDSFVHRLLQNKCDGKMVELSGRYGPRHDEKDDAEGGEEKIDAMQLEFTYLLTSQLQSQRNYFEERLSLAEKDMRSRTDFLMGKLELIETDRQSLESKLSAMQKEKVNLEKKIAQLTQKLVKATTDVKEEKEFNKCLEKDTKGWKEQIAKLESEYNEYKIAKEAEISDLKEQLRDVMFFLESKSQIEKSIYKDEIVDGQVTVDESSVPSTSKKANRKKKR
jgi:BRCA1-associated protein